MTHKVVSKNQTNEMIEITVKAVNDKLALDTRKAIHEAIFRLNKKRKRLMNPVSYKIVFTSNPAINPYEELKTLNIDSIKPVVANPK